TSASGAAGGKARTPRSRVHLSGSLSADRGHDGGFGRITMKVESLIGAAFALRRRMVAMSTTVSSGAESVRTNTRRLATPLGSVVSTYVRTRAVFAAFTANV